MFLPLVDMRTPKSHVIVTRDRAMMQLMPHILKHKLEKGTPCVDLPARKVVLKNRVSRFDSSILSLNYQTLKMITIKNYIDVRFEN